MSSKIKNEDQTGSKPRQREKDYFPALFPALAPYATGFLPVGGVHNLYWEQCGNPDGVPIVFLHGGPGAGTTPAHRRFFDPDHYRIILFDQRGAGRSTPFCCLENNTLSHLIQDLETLRTHFGLQRWHVFGGSWGSTLALHYAAAYPQNCISLILRGIFLCEQYEIDWFIHDMGRFFPEVYEEFVSFIPENERDDLLGAYYKRLTGQDEKTKMDAAIHWSRYEDRCAALIPEHKTMVNEEQKHYAYSCALLEAHYFIHEVVPADRSIFTKMAALKSIPAIIIQGRYDIICPPHTAHKLQKAWPGADYVIVPDAGHSALDPPLRARLIEATENFKALK